MKIKEWLRRPLILLAVFMMSAVMLLGCTDSIFSSENISDISSDESGVDWAELINGLLQSIMGSDDAEDETLPEDETEAVTEATTEAVTEAATEISTEAVTEATTEAATEAVTEASTEASTEAITEAVTEASTEAVTEAVTEAGITVEKGGRYSTKEEVALYLHIYGELPSNFITKHDAKEIGWKSNKGNLWDVTDQMSIGGDRFGNNEGLLPTESGRKYYECDINYNGGYRGKERIIYSNDGLIFYTNDHYESFEQLY